MRHFFAVVTIVALVAGSAGADDAGAGAAIVKLECARVPEPGRVRCDVELRAPAGTVLRWADVAIVSVPPFATALKARVGPRDASAKEDAVWRWSIALAAKERGSGNLEARVHLVACASATSEACAPSEVSASASVVVGD